MELIKNGPEQCRCYDRLAAFAADHAEEGVPLRYGAQVRCQCGRHYQLAEDQRDGAYWKLIQGTAQP
jgi:hypothetical protein